jgi:hypothetical protein
MAFAKAGSRLQAFSGLVEWAYGRFAPEAAYQKWPFR